MSHAIPQWPLFLSQVPTLALVAVGIHGPRITQRFRSDRHWWLHLYSYHAALRVGGCEMAIKPGCASLIPPGEEVEYDFHERSVHLCAHFTLPDDTEAEVVSVPAMQDLGDAFAPIYERLAEAAACFPVNPLRAQVRLWDILWQITERAPQTAPPLHPNPAPVERARQIIELRLSETLSVKALAEEVGVSHNHLTRLFHVAIGDTVIGYIRQRRVQRAQHLLEHTTLPVKTVAAQVGLDDPRQFYKLIREELGFSPTQVRAQGQGG